MNKYSCKLRLLVVAQCYICHSKKLEFLMSYGNIGCFQMFFSGSRNNFFFWRGGMKVWTGSQYM